MLRYVAFLVLSILQLSVESPEQKSKDVLKITLYYESLCPYCKAFVVEQFFPGYKKLNSFLEIDLVPFGNAKYNKTDGIFHFKCQHGIKECLGNKIQACGIAEGKGQDKDMEFVNCLMSQLNPDSTQAVAQCASTLSVSSDSLLSCANGSKGDELLAKYGDRTNAIKSLIEGVPSIFVNDEFDDILNDRLAEDFFATICSLLTIKPSVCPKSTDDLITTNDV